MIIVDLSGVSVAALRRGMPLIKEAAKVGLNNFPEGTHCVLVVNAPSIFAAMVRLCSLCR